MLKSQLKTTDKLSQVLLSSQDLNLIVARLRRLIQFQNKKLNKCKVILFN